MRRRLGLAVSRTMLRAVALERGRVTWAAERPLAGPEEIATAFAELAAERPRGIARARVVLDGELVQVKLLDGFPRLSQPKLERAVALQASRWFLKNGTPLVTGAARLRGARVLAAAAPRDALDAVAEGLARAGLALDAVGTGMATAAALLPDGEHVMASDGVTRWLSVVGGEARSWRCIVGPAVADAAWLRSVPGLEIDGARFLTAYAAAAVAPRPSLAAGLSDAERVARLRRVLIRLAGTACVLWAAAGAVFAIRVQTALRSTRAELAELGPALDAAVAVERDVALANEMLGAVRAARISRSRDAVLLSVLTRALPDSAYLVSLHRSRDGRVAVQGYAPSAADLVAALSRAPGVLAPALQGGVAREVAAGRSRERFGLAFTWQPPERAQ